MTAALKGICSMATRGLLDELAATFARSSNGGGLPVAFLAVGGVDAARRIAAREPFDLAVLASDAIDTLAAAGHVDAAGKVDLVRSALGVAVRADAPAPDVATDDAVRAALQSASGIGYSTGPSGTALIALFERWGLRGALQGRLVQAAPGVPVATLVARGEVSIGFQQMSELVGVAGIRLLGPLAPALRIETVFSAAPTTGCAQPVAVRALLDFLASAAAADAMRRHGLPPA